MNTTQRVFKRRAAFNTSPSDGKTNVSALSADAEGNRVETSAGSVDYYLSGKNIVFKIRLADLGADKDTIYKLKPRTTSLGKARSKYAKMLGISISRATALLLAD